jgi:IS5 family transposase
MAVTRKRGLVLGARSFPGNPYDGQSLAGQIEQTTTLLQDLSVKPPTAVVDLGYRGVDHLVPVNIIHRGRYKTMTDQQRRCLGRRQAIEPTIGHTKLGPGMQRCWLKGIDGDALHAVLSAAGFNVRWLMRAVARGSLAAVVLALLGLHWMVGHLSNSRSQITRPGHDWPQLDLPSSGSMGGEFRHSAG